MRELDPALKAALSDRYVIERPIGEGGMAVVYEAKDRKHGRTVALKVLRPEVASDIGAQRFLDEIRIAAQLNHPHIVALHDSGEAAGWLYYVMPYVAGESLRARLAREGTLPETEAVTIVREIGDALGYAHRLGIVHRDIKPENILLFEGHATLADFGIARAAGSARAAEEGRLTHTGHAIGTPAYMSPEQIIAERDIDGRADIYSLGCVLYEMLTGRSPFAAANAAAMMAARFRGGATSLEGLGGVSDAVARAVACAMALDPVDRFDTASAFVDALTSAAVAALARKSIVVLPFANMSSDAENEYFSDGLTEELISDLSRVTALRVISRTSAMMLKGQVERIPAIARRLGVRYALEGSVRKAGNSVRISVQLIDAPNDSQLWSDKYSGTLDDVFNLQERVSREIVHALDVTLTADEDRRLAWRPIADARVYDFYLRARQGMHRMTAESIARTAALLDEGLRLAPGNPLLETAKGQLEIWRAKTSAGYDEALMRQVEERARELATNYPELGEVHALLGGIALARGDLISAIRQVRRATALDSFPEWTLWLGFCYLSGGAIPEFKALGRELVDLDPLWQPSWGQLAASELFDGHIDAALAPAERALTLDPEGLLSRWFYAYVLALNGRLAELQGQVTQLSAGDAGSPYTRQAVALAAALGGNRERALEVLETVGDLGVDAHLRFHLAESWIAAGDHDRGLSELAQATEGFHPAEFIATHNPVFAPVRGDSRFMAIVAEAKRRSAEFRREAIDTVSS
jgi:eukaryotic-like serine/threonine-protein kinase